MGDMGISHQEVLFPHFGNPAAKFRSSANRNKLTDNCITSDLHIGFFTFKFQCLGFSQNTLSLLKKAYRIIFRIGLTLNEAIERVQAEVEQVPEVINLINFIKSSQRGVTR